MPANSNTDVLTIDRELAHPAAANLHCSMCFLETAIHIRDRF